MSLRPRSQRSRADSGARTAVAQDRRVRVADRSFSRNANRAPHDCGSRPLLHLVEFLRRPTSGGTTRLRCDARYDPARSSAGPQPQALHCEPIPPSQRPQLRNPRLRGLSRDDRVRLRCHVGQLRFTRGTRRATIHALPALDRPCHDVLLLAGAPRGNGPLNELVLDALRLSRVVLTLGVVAGLALIASLTIAPDKVTALYVGYGLVGLWAAALASQTLVATRRVLSTA